MKNKYVLISFVIFLLICSSYAYCNEKQNISDNIIIPNITKTITKNPSDYDSAMQKAESAMKINNYDEAIRICNYLLAQNRNDLEVVSLLYYCLSQQGATDTQIIKAIAPDQINKPLDQVYTNMAVLMITKTTHINTAKSMAERAQKINPTNKQINYVLYNAFMKINNKEEAIKILK